MKSSTLILTLCAFVAATFAPKRTRARVLRADRRPVRSAARAAHRRFDFRGLHAAVRALLKDRANVHRIPVNGGPSSRAVARLDQWIGDRKWDVIHSIWHPRPGARHGAGGRWSLAITKRIFARCDELKATGARLIWATTTPIPEGAVAPAFDFAKCPNTTPSRNA